MKSNKSPPSETKARSIAIRLSAIFFVVYCITAPGGFEVIDGEARYETAKSWLSGNGGALPPLKEQFGVPGRDGHYYSWYGPFQSILMVPLAAMMLRIAPAHADQLFKLIFGVIAIPLLSALSLGVLFLALRALHIADRPAFLAVATIGLATPMWHYSRSGQEENIIGLAFALYLLGIGQLANRHFGGLKQVAYASSIIFATRWSYIPALLILLFPVVLLLWQRRAEWHAWLPQLALSAAVVATTVFGVLGYNIYRFGRPFESGYGLYFLIHPPFFTFADAPNHVLALVVSPYRGLLWFCPALLLLFGLRNTSNTTARVWLTNATWAAWLFTWLFIGSFSFWNGGPAWGPRYLVALVVLLAPGFASVFASGRRWIALFAISMVVQFSSTLLPSSSEDFAYATLNARRAGACTPWVCECSALCLRGPWALKAVSNTLLSRALPVLELNGATIGTAEVSALETSDFNSVYWWPVRAAYRAHKLNPALAFTLCMLILCAAMGALVIVYRRLSLFPPGGSVPVSGKA